jgi:hypothetical protein
LWLDIYTAIDRHLKTNAFPVSISLYIKPPPGYKVKMGMSGMIQPETNDTADYAYYIAAIKLDREKLKIANYQHYLHNIDMLANSEFEYFINTYYTQSESDKQEFDALLDQAPLSDARKQKLKKMFNN